MYIYDKIRKRMLPKEADLITIQLQADDDNDRTRDVRPLMSTLMRFRRADPRLRGHILTRSTAVSAFAWNIMPASANPSPQELEQTERARLRCSMLIQNVIAHRLQASLYDAMVIQTEIDYGTPIGNIQRPKRRFRPVELEKTDDYTVSIFAGSQEKNVEFVLPVDITALPVTDERSSFIVAIGDDDERGGLLRSIARHEILLYDMTTEWANFNKKLKGIIQAIYMEGAEEDEKAAAIESVKQVAKENYTATSDAIEFKFNQMAQAGSGLSFKDMITGLNTDIALTLLGQANTAQLPSGGGSRAALQVLNLIRSDIMFDDMIRTEHCINFQVLLNDARLNIDQNLTEPPYKFSFNMPDGIDPEVRARIITDAYNAGIPLLKSDVYKEIGATVPPDGAKDILQKQSAML